MIDVFYFYKMPVAVLGLGRSGLATCKALIDSEAALASSFVAFHSAIGSQ